MKLNRKNLYEYLLTLQLIEAGYHITFDEVFEQITLKEFLSIPLKQRKDFFKGKLSLHRLEPKYKWYEEYSMTLEQNKQWFVKSCKIVQKHFKCSYLYSSNVVGMIDLHQGLTIKG